MKKLFFISLLGCFLLTGCASILGSTEETITINTNLDNANLKVKNRSGLLIYDGKAPATLTLKKKNGFFSGEKYTIVAQKTGYPSQARTIDTSLSGWYAGNLIFGGLIGWLIVDPATGAMWKFDENSVLINISRDSEIENKNLSKEEKETLF